MLLLSRSSHVRLCDPIDSSPLVSAVPGILQARTLEWVGISFSNAWKWKVKVKLLSRVWLLLPHRLQPARLLCPWDFPGKNNGVGCHFLLQGNLPNLEIEPGSPALQTDSLLTICGGISNCLSSHYGLFLLVFGDLFHFLLVRIQLSPNILFCRLTEANFQFPTM